MIIVFENKKGRVGVPQLWSFQGGRVRDELIEFTVLRPLKKRKIR